MDPRSSRNGGSRSTSDPLNSRSDCAENLGVIARSPKVASHNSPARGSPFLMMFAAWWALVLLGFAILVQHSLKPGRSGQPPARWPASSRLKFESDRMNLVMAIHPRCPCSRASLTELSQLLTSAGAAVSAHVVFIRPIGSSEKWIATDLWRRANALPGAHAMIDSAGPELERFGALTSGDVALYDRSGRLLFSGGVTGARGHVGANRGARSLALAISGKAHDGTAPVYGCPISAETFTTK